MDFLERVWEGTGNFFTSVLQGVERSVTGIFGSSNARQIRRFEAIVQRINALEDGLKQLTDAQLREKTREFQQRIKDGQSLDELLVEAFAVCREGGRRFLNMRHYDVQLIGGIVLHNGMIAEMVTGEGKTLVATLPTYLNALAGKGCHVVTVNDYLARRDMEWMAPLYMGLGLTVDAIQGGLSNDERQAAYACDITYATNNELGFDYLRDNMRLAARNDNRFPKHLQQVQGPLAYAIIDEVDNILIDEARTPLIISGPAHQDIGKYAEADKVARKLIRDEHFVVNEKDHNVNLTDDGVRSAEKLAGVESFYTAGNMEWPHLIDNALKAHYLYKRDVNYVVKENAIVIVDDFTGRLMEGRQWSDGLHQAVEAKEGVKIKEETQTLATITLQNFFKLYKKIAGMTGTAMTEANEFWKIYKLDVVAIPTNRKLQRIEYSDTIFLTEKEKFTAVADDVERTCKYDIVATNDRQEVVGEITQESESQVTVKLKGTKETQVLEKSKVSEIDRKGRPVLIGTVSIEKSEQLSRLLELRGIPHQVLNAKHHRREAEIIAQAGRVGAVTIATNMAGRGTDIILGGNPETMAWAQLQDKYSTRLDVPLEEWNALVGEIEQREKMKVAGLHVREIGGLYVIGTERHESRRIDLQLRGRCGRQGDPGSSRFYLSLEDDLMRIFAGDWVRGMMSKLGMGEGEAIENTFVSRRITAAQKKVEERNFEIRKNLLEYDEVMDQQRKRVYSYRQQILDGVSCRRLVLEQIQQQIEHYVDQYLDPLFGAESYTKYASKMLSCELEARDFRNVDPGTAATYAFDAAVRAAETQIHDAVEENLPLGEPEDDWNWEALAKWVNTRYGTTYSVRDLQKKSRDRIDEELIERVQERLNAVDLSDGAPLLGGDYGLQMLTSWAKNKFGIEVEIDDLRSREPSDIAHELVAIAEKAYQKKEAEYPVMAGIMRYGRMVSQTQFQLDKDSLITWAQSRFETSIQTDEIAGNTLNEVRDKLTEYSQKHYEQAAKTVVVVDDKIGNFFDQAEANTSAKYIAGGNGNLDSLSDWFQQSLQHTVSSDVLGEMDEEGMRREALQAIDDRFFPEMRRMERHVLLNIVDAAWKDHLLAMDHLRSAITLKSFAQMDPKVEYKREGMRMYGQMWFTIGERMTDLIFRMEALDENFVASTWQETNARHDVAQSPTQMMEQKNRDLEAADRAGAPEAKLEPIRNTSQRIGRNDPCPCGSGKKYKACHGRNA
ncbi:MAG: preprotein translocase subunit SecA [Planctomycetales bacterium]|nr:preprotein translocase subunit SecA [Planctomycetales bacterium]